jgi:homoserine kinase
VKVKEIDHQVHEVSVFAPATVANVAVGFDILGFAIDGPGDILTLKRVATPGVKLVGLDPGLGLPNDPALNTATAGMLLALSDHGVGAGFEVRIKKGIPLASGMGGSAASAIAGIVALNTFFREPLPAAELLRYAIVGESVASGARHADNLAPCLLGGLQLVRSVDPVDVVPLAVPRSLFCALVHPELRVETRAAREVLRRDVTLRDHVLAAANLGAVISACQRSDFALLKRALRDELIEPQRAPLVRGFDKVKREALGAGALGASLSGAGPSIFAWVEGEERARQVAAAMEAGFRSEKIACASHVSRVGAPGARILHRA